YRISDNNVKSDELIIYWPVVAPAASVREVLDGTSGPQIRDLPGGAGRLLPSASHGARRPPDGGAAVAPGAHPHRDGGRVGATGSVSGRLAASGVSDEPLVVVGDRAAHDVASGGGVVDVGDLAHGRCRVGIRNLLVGEKVVPQAVDERARHLRELGVVTVGGIVHQHSD